MVSWSLRNGQGFNRCGPGQEGSGQVTIFTTSVRPQLVGCLMYPGNTCYEEKEVGQTSTAWNVASLPILVPVKTSPAGS